jgi:hypothetical protein
MPASSIPSASTAHAEEAGAPGDEIEVTPAMIEAGVNVLWESGAIETPMQDFDRDLVRKIFLAMSHALGVLS